MSSVRSVPFFDYKQHFTADQNDLVNLFVDVGRRGAFIMQSDVRDFEESLAKYAQSKYSIGVGNATDGLEFCWMAQNLKPGDEVIFSSHTMVATASAIKTAGGVPVPVDIGPDNLIDPDAVEDAVNSNTVGIMPTQLNGRICDMTRLLDIAEKKGLILIEDAAQSLGAKFEGQQAGTFGAASAISFFPAKVLGSLGDAGGVLTSDPHLFDKIYQLHDHGRNIDGDTVSWGRNSRLDNIQAAILNFKLTNYKDVVERRRSIARRYYEHLRDIEELKLPPHPDSDPMRYDVYQNYEIEAKNRDELKKHLTQNQIGTLIQWGGVGVHQIEALGFKVQLPRVEQFFLDCIMLPMNTFITDVDVNYVCEKIKSFYRS